MKSEEELFDSLVSKKVRNLDSRHKVSESEKTEIWNSIRSKKDKKKYLLLIRIAASVILIACLSMILDRLDDSTTLENSIAISKEINHETDGINIFENEGVEFIKESCRKELPVCQTPEFQHLLSELELTDMEITRLSEKISTYGQNPNLIKAQSEIQNFRIELTQRMIEIILS